MTNFYQFRWQQIAHRLMKDLDQSTTLVLPGIQALGKNYGVSRITIERALVYLQELGVVTPAETGKHRQVNRRELQKIMGRRDAENRHIVFLTQDSLNNPVYATKNFFERIREIAGAEGLHVNYLQIPSSAEKIRILLQSVQPAGVILYVVPGFVAEVTASLGLSAVCVDVNTTQLTSFNTFYPGLLLQGFERAWDAGHKRVVVPLWGKSDKLRDGLTKELEPAFSQLGQPFSSAYHIPLIPGSNSNEYAAGLEKIFHYTPPTCLIVGNFQQFVMAACFFLKKGLRIAADVSVILLQDDPLVQTVSPSLAHFEAPTHELTLKVFARLMETMKGEARVERFDVVRQWVAGDSLAQMQ